MSRRIHPIIHDAMRKAGWKLVPSNNPGWIEHNPATPEEKKELAIKALCDFFSEKNLEEISKLLDDRRGILMREVEKFNDKDWEDVAEIMTQSNPEKFQKILTFFEKKSLKEADIKLVLGEPLASEKKEKSPRKP